MLAKSEVVTERRSRNQIPKPPYRRTQRARRVCRRRISLRPSACSCSMDWIGLKICPTHMHARKQHFDPLWHRAHWGEWRGHGANRTGCLCELRCPPPRPLWLKNFAQEREQARRRAPALHRESGSSSAVVWI